MLWGNSLWAAFLECGGGNNKRSPLALAADLKGTISFGAPGGQRGDKEATEQGGELASPLRTARANLAEQQCANHF